MLTWTALAVGLLQTREADTRQAAGVQVTRVAGLILALLAIGSCHQREESTREARQPESVPGLVSLYQGLDSGFLEQVREVVRDSARFRAVWDLSCCLRNQRRPRPEIDFTRYMVVLAVDSRGVLGDSVIIQQVSEDNGSLRVRVISDQRCLPVQVRTRPVHLVRVPLRRDAAVFDNQAVRGPNCM